MANIGAEVGQKMRSAIKAKLLELNCYVDDELPDYVMVMVANKRTRSQMKDDLNLFLANKTGTFVDWLHIVLKKLKEVTVTNPDIYKKTVKRKSVELPNTNVKKEKREKKVDGKVKQIELGTKSAANDEQFKSLTDDLPICANRLSEQRKIIIMRENSSEVVQDNFDIPLLSEVNMSTEEELEDIEKKIKSVKSRLGLLVESDGEDDCISLKTEPEREKKSRKVKIVNLDPVEIPTKHTRITFSNDGESQKRKSVLERLGKRPSSETAEESPKKNKLDVPEARKEPRLGREGDNIKESALNRLGVMSRVAVPSKQPEEPEQPFKNREVSSVVKIKPRVIPHDAPQANKNLLLKAVAEAQRSIAQTPQVGTNLKPDALFTKKYKDKLKEEQVTGRKLPDSEKYKIQKMITPAPEEDKDEDEYVPETVVKPQNQDRSNENGRMKQQFIVTLDGIEKTKFKDLVVKDDPKPPVKSRLENKRPLSPIVFDKVTTTIKSKSSIPDKLPVVHASASVKNKERCKYWPSCRQGDKCEFVHPCSNCEKFPHCKFGEKCLFLHPNCKFGSSCTRRDCVYSHASGNKVVGSRIGSTGSSKVASSTQTCKFFPSCTNVSCTFYHPKLCKFGKYCKNQSECSFSHAFINKASLTWRSK